MPCIAGLCKQFQDPHIQSWTLTIVHAWLLHAVLTSLSANASALPALHDCIIWGASCLLLFSSLLTAFSMHVLRQLHCVAQAGSFLYLFHGWSIASTSMSLFDLCCCLLSSVRCICYSACMSQTTHPAEGVISIMCNCGDIMHSTLQSDRLPLVVALEKTVTHTAWGCNCRLE